MKMATTRVVEHMVVFATTWAFCIICVSGNMQVFKATPMVIQPGVTETLKLRCSAEPAPTDDQERFKYVVSFFICKLNKTTNDRETIARLTAFGTPTVLGDQGNAKVEGSIGKSDFLEVTWTKPNRDQTGNYSCEIHALDNSMKPLYEDDKLTVEELTPDEEDVNKTVSNLTREIEYNKVAIRGLTLTIDELMSRILDLQSTIEAMKTAMEKAQADTNQRIQSLQNEIEKSVPGGFQVESNVTSCVNGSSEWIYFSKAFNEAPHVLTFVQSVQIHPCHPNATNLVSRVVGVATVGFFLECLSDFPRAEIGWLAVTARQRDSVTDE